MKAFTFAFLTGACLTAQVASAQNLPHIGYVYPAGGRQGSTFQVVVGGQYLGSATNLLVTDGGVTAELRDYSRPMTQREFNELREQMEELRKKRQALQSKGKNRKAPARGWTAADERLFAEVRMKLAKFQRRPPNPAIAETVTLSVSIAADAKPGQRELRLRSATGLSNPMVFKVGVLPEVAEKPETTKEERPAAFRRLVPETPVNPPEMTVAIPVVVNGQIMAGDVDRIKFRAREGQKLVIAASARELVPYLPDAVPGWFQATLALFDSKGREIAYDDDFRFHPDPVLFFTAPANGEYAVEIKDSIYRGREDFVYRIEIGELPFVTGVFPMGANAGSEATAELSGWNLREQTLNVPARPGSMGIEQLHPRSGDATANPIPFERGDLPEILEQEPNNDKSAAAPVKLPVVVNGRIDAAGDADLFRFEGKAGMEIVAETAARRLNSPLDSILTLAGPDGKTVAANDDFEDKGAGLTTHQADSRILVKLPADGVYTLQLADTQGKGGIEYAYRLRLSAPQPGFELRVVPSSVTVRAGGTVPLTVYALRKDGFDGEILISTDEGDAGVVLSGARVPPGVEQVKITLTASNSRQGDIFPINLEGRALVGGKVVTRPVVPAEDMMQAFFYRHLVPSKEMLVCVSGAFPQRWPVQIASDLPVKIPEGGTASVRLTMPRANSDRAQVTLCEPPEGITIRKIAPWARGTEIILACESGKAKPGTRGNLIFEPQFARAPANKKASGTRNPMGSLPAVPFEIVK